MPAILTVTLNPTVDLAVEVDRLISEGKNRARMRTVQGGGGGINIARCVRKLGGTATAVHTRGGDMGRWLDRLLDAEGIEHRSIEVEAETRAAFVVAEACTGHSYHIVPAGNELGAADAERYLAAIAEMAPDFAYLVISGSAPPGLRPDFCAELARRMSTHETRVVLDIAGEQLRNVLREKVFLIRLDRREAAALIGRPIDGFAAARAANAYLLAQGGAAHAVTTVGALGAAYSNDRSHHLISAPPPPLPPRSDACAGDSLIGAICQVLASDPLSAEAETVLRACAYGVAAAAATVLLPGTDVFERATVDAFVGEVRTRSEARRSTSPRPAVPIGSAGGE